LVSVIDSPYSPGFGERPTVFVGRDAEIARARATLTKVSNTQSSATGTLVLVGARGLGKTVTLGAIADDSAKRGFVTATVQLDRVSDSAQLVAEQVARAVADLESSTREALWHRFSERLKVLSIELNAGIVKVTSPAPAASTPAARVSRRQALTDVLVEGAHLAAAHDRAGLVLFLDELQEAQEADLVVLTNALQDVGRTGGTPLAVFGAGLVTAPDKLMDAASFAERFDFQQLAPLGDDEAARALVEPALTVDVTWASDAVDHLVSVANGSPYMIQRLGHEAWSIAAPGRHATIGLPAARSAADDVMEALSHGMFRGRWNKSTPVERVLLAAMAIAADRSGVAHTRHITALTGRTTPQLSTARKSLIDKGIIEPAGHARLRFSIAGFGDYVLDRVGLEWAGPAALDAEGLVPRLELGYADRGDV
jgi:hypothetical protein